MKLNKVYTINVRELCEELGIEPWDFPFHEVYDNFFDDMTLHCDNESYQWYLDHIDIYSQSEMNNILKAVELLRNNYGVYCDVVVGEFQWPAKPSPKEEL